MGDDLLYFFAEHDDQQPFVVVRDGHPGDINDPERERPR